MNNGIDIQDYQEGVEPDLQDPTALTEEVDKAFMDKLAKTVTKFEEVLCVGSGDLSLNDLHKWIDVRGDALDMLDDLEIAEWLTHMRQISRCPFRKFGVDRG